MDKNNYSFLLFVLLLWSCSHLSVNENIPVYPGGYSINKGGGNTDSDSFVVYKVDMEYPPIKVVEFYEQHINFRGYKPYHDDGYGLSRWERFNRRSGEWEETEVNPTRYIASWVDSKMERRILLRLLYKYDGTNPKWRSTLLIDYREVPFFDFRQIEPPPPDKGQ